MPESFAERFKAEQECLKRLSPRVLEVYRGILDGRNNHEIASELGLSDKTINTYKGILRGRLGCDSDVDLIKFGIRHHMTKLWTIPPPLPHRSIFNKMRTAASF